MKKIVIIGAGGLGREVLNLINFCNNSENEYNPLGFIVDSEYGQTGTIINEKPILGNLGWLEKHASDVNVVVAVGQPHLRLRVLDRISKYNCKFINLIHPWSKEHLNKWVSLGEGVILAGCLTSSQIKIGNHVVINVFCVIGHDSVISDYATLAPSVNIDGYVTLGTGCFIGTGSNILPNVTVNEWSIIGAGSTISKDIPANSVAMNLPPRIINQRDPGWHLSED
mgnify:CR=1 FL=1